MDGSQFDHLIRAIGSESSRRMIVRRVVAGLGALAVGRVAIEDAEAAPRKGKRCVNVGRSCKKRRGKPRPKCCAGSVCRGNRCQCRPNRRKCGNKCITKKQCCHDGQCTGAKTGNCVNNRCQAAFQTCTSGTGRVAFVKGPGNPPRSTGSVQFTVDPDLSLQDWTHLRFAEFAGTPLTDIRSLRFSVLVRPLEDGTCPSRVYTPYLGLYVTAGGQDHVMVSAEYRPNPESCNTWQQVDAGLASSLWWSPTMGTFAPQGSPRPLSDFIDAYPDIAIRNAETTDTQCPTALGGLRLEAGEWGGTGITGEVTTHVSYLRVVAAGKTRTFKF